MKDLQDKFQNYLLHSDCQIQPFIVSTKQVPAELRLSIYGNAYRSRLIEALEASYPTLMAYMGEENFYSLSHDYIDLYPSSYRSIRWFGDQLSAFLYTQHQYANYPLLAELATVEWTLSLVFDAAESEVMSLDAMSQVPPDAWVTLRCQLHPSVHLLHLSWNAIPIWQALSQEQTPPNAVQSAMPISWVLWRKELLNQFYSLTVDEAWAMEAIAKGHVFSALCEGLCQFVAEQEVVIHAVSLLKKWIVLGLIKGETYDRP